MRLVVIVVVRTVVPVVCLKNLSRKPFPFECNVTDATGRCTDMFCNVCCVCVCVCVCFCVNVNAIASAIIIPDQISRPPPSSGPRLVVDDG